MFFFSSFNLAMQLDQNMYKDLFLVVLFLCNYFISSISMDAWLLLERSGACWPRLD